MIKKHTEHRKTYTQPLNLIAMFPSVVVDYQSQKIRIASAKLPYPKHAKVVPMEDKLGFSPILRLNFHPNIQGVPIALDTGKNSGFALPPQLLGELAEHNKLGQFPIFYMKSKEQTGIFDAREKRMALARVNEVELGEFHIDNMVIRFDDGLPLLGNEFLKNFKLYLYWQDGLLALEEVEVLSTLTNGPALVYHPPIRKMKG